MLVSAKMYNDDPHQEVDFESAHMGIFNMESYCNVHDILLQHDPQSYFQNKFFVTDYHQMSLIRMFVMGKMGEDVMPKLSKNMSKINFHQKLYPIDLRTNMFFFKKASFHNYHEIGKNFACFGQSYNHIPGHGHLTRKDLLTVRSMKWNSDLFGKDNDCRDKMEYVPRGYRLDIKRECTDFFKILNSKGYLQVVSLVFLIFREKRNTQCNTS